MRLHAGLIKTFWANAVNTAAYLINRRPSVLIEFKLPKEVWSSKEVMYKDRSTVVSDVTEIDQKKSEFVNLDELTEYTIQKRGEEDKENVNSQPRQQLTGELWKPPPSEAYKLNFDAALFSDLGRTRFGAIVRNEKGEAMATMTVARPDVHTSDEAELLACQKALEFAVDAGFSRLIIEGDNSNVIHAISSSEENASLFDNVVDDIRHLIRGLHWSKVCCIRRSGNKVAHALAQYARHNLDEDLF
nr:uncharacterized protein LOC112030680 [Quercus suber]